MVMLGYVFFSSRRRHTRLRISDWSSDVCSSDLYLDGFEAIFAKKQSLRVQAVRGGRAYAEFRGFPPKSRDDLKKALGDQIKVQESDWNCGLYLTPNHKRKPFDKADARRALTQIGRAHV